MVVILSYVRGQIAKTPDYTMKYFSKGLRGLIGNEFHANLWSFGQRHVFL